MPQTSVWIATPDDVDARLRSGIAVADLGCGVGTRTLELAIRYPRSTFTGFDSREASIVAARKAAAEAGLTGRVGFEVAPAASFPASYGLVGNFAPGTWLLVEPVPEARRDELLAQAGLRHIRWATAAPSTVVLELGR